jgi:hypothetical protein
MPIAMFGAMMVAVLLTNILPEELVSFTWPWFDEIRAAKAS